MNLQENLVWSAASAVHQVVCDCGEAVTGHEVLYYDDFGESDGGSVAAGKAAVVATLRTLADYESGSEDFDFQTRLLLTGALRSLANSVEGLF